MFRRNTVDSCGGFQIGASTDVLLEGNAVHMGRSQFASVGLDSTESPFQVSEGVLGLVNRSNVHSAGSMAATNPAGVSVLPRLKLDDTISKLPRPLEGSPLGNAAISATAAASTAKWQNSTSLTVYRVTPIGQLGLADMDTADAPGDVYFGLSQLLLPYACGHGGGNSVWCGNRKWLSGGTAWMVYRKFTVDARLPLGEYARCNPDPATGKFSCDGGGSGGGGGLPRSCGNATVKYDQHHSRYVNGTVYATLQLPPNTDQQRCCDKCSADGSGCYGWQYTKPQAKTTGVECSFIGPDGALITESYKEFARKQILTEFSSLDDFIRKWNDAEKKAAIIQELEEHGILLENLAEEVGKDFGDFDLLCHIAYDQPPLTRAERANNVKKRNYFTKYGDEARKVLSALLDKYADEGVRTIEDARVLRLDPFDEIGTPVEIIRDVFGGKEQYEQAVRELEQQIYRQADG